MIGTLTALKEQLKDRLPFSSKRKSGEQLGIHISNDQISLAEIVREGDKEPRLSLFTAAPCSDPANRMNVLKELVEKHTLHKKHAVIVLHAEEYLIEQIEAPDVEDKEMLKSLKWRVKDLLDYPIEKASIDYLDMPKHQDALQRKVYAVATKSSLIRERSMLVEDAGLIPDVIDISDLALTNLVPFHQNNDEEIIATLYFDQSYGIITFSRGNQLCLSRRLDYGIQSIIDSEPSAEELATIKRDRAIMDTASVQEDDSPPVEEDNLPETSYSDNLLNQDPREFAKISSSEELDQHLQNSNHLDDELSLSTEGWSSDSPESDPFAPPVDPLSSPMESFEKDPRHDMLDEIQRSVDYFNHQNSEETVSQLVIVPIQQHAPYFLEQLGDVLEIPIQEMDLGKRLQYFGYIYDEYKICCSLAIGAALRQNN
jgi:MSHA biogenesis protein MshI